MTRAPLARPTDAPPVAHAAHADGEVSGAPIAAGGPPPADALPAHVAIIMDGNRRLARALGLPEADGHAAGVEHIRRLVEHTLRRGEQRLSNFLTWQGAYAESWSCDALWPDFDAAACDAALEGFTRRARRDGT